MSSNTVDRNAARVTIAMTIMFLSCISIINVDGFSNTNNIINGKHTIHGTHANQQHLLSFVSSSALSAIPPVVKGCAAVPFDKKKIAVFGTGGYLGTLIFGFLQRASSIYGTGLSGAATSTPRAICATSTASATMNRLLSSHFKLAFAGEEFTRLADMKDVKSVARCLAGIDAVVIGTVCELEVRSITGGTYETSPNDKTVEFYMDECYMAVPSEEVDEDLGEHLRLFRNALEGCKRAGVKHVVVLETPKTRARGWAGEFAKVLDQVGVVFTYIRAGGESVEWGRTKYYTFEDGVQSRLNVESFTLADGYKDWAGYDIGDWMESFTEEVIPATTDTTTGTTSSGYAISTATKKRRREKTTLTNVIPREDVAAVVVQSLMSLDWEQSRCLRVTSDGDIDGEAKDEEKSEDDVGKNVKRRRKENPMPERTDREWCIKSNVIAEILGTCD